MAAFELIVFQKTRDFSNKLNATFEFFKQNFKSLAKCLLYFVGPPALVTSLLIGSVFGDYIKMVMSLAAGGGQSALTDFLASVNFWLAVGFAVVIGTITAVMMTSTINNYVILYNAKKSNQIETEEVWELVKKTFWMYFSTLIGYVLLLVAAYVVLLIPIVALAQVSGFLVFFLVLAFIIAIMYFFIATSLIFSIRGFERVGFFESISRSIYLIRGKWWSTFGLLIIFSFIVSTVSSIFILPWYVSFIISTLHNVERGVNAAPTESNSLLAVISFSLYYMVYYVLSSLPQLGLIFQYFNLVEQKESKGLMEQMGALGSPEPPKIDPGSEQY
jgi:hypothetical protein